MGPNFQPQPTNDNLITPQAPTPFQPKIFLLFYWPREKLEAHQQGKRDMDIFFTGLYVIVLEGSTKNIIVDIGMPLLFSVVLKTRTWKWKVEQRY